MAAHNSSSDPGVEQRAALASALLAEPHGHKSTEHWWGSYEEAGFP